MSPLGWNCNSETGSCIHSLWSCVKLQRYWLIFAARKNILLFWIKDDAPTIHLWRNIIMDCIPREYINILHVFLAPANCFLSDLGSLPAAYRAHAVSLLAEISLACLYVLVLSDRYLMVAMEPCLFTCFLFFFLQ